MRQHGQKPVDPRPGGRSRSPERIHLHLDAVRGIAGDMILASMIDLGVPPDAIFGPLRAAPDFPPFSVEIAVVSRRSLQARTVEIVPEEADAAHRGLSEIEAILAGLDLPRRVLERSRACFRLLAEAEGAVHGIAPEAVHFHEVGAVDSLVDIIGSLIAVEHLAPEGVSISSLPLGSGTVSAAHGRLPVPAPATLRLLEGVPTHPFEVGREVTTPTGAALARTIADRFGPPPAGRILTCGTGAGSREAPPEHPPNLLRAWTVEVSEELHPFPSDGGDEEASSREPILELATNVDTASGEDAGTWIETLLAAGAVDAWIPPILAKKGRPGWILTALAPPAAAAVVRRTILTETGSLGVRERSFSRTVLPREITEETVAGHRVRVKRAWLEGALVSVRVEHDDLRRVARETGRPLRDVRAELEGELSQVRGSQRRASQRRGKEDH